MNLKVRGQFKFCKIWYVVHRNFQNVNIKYHCCFEIPAGLCNVQLGHDMHHNCCFSLYFNIQTDCILGSAYVCQ